MGRSRPHWPGGPSGRVVALVLAAGIGGGLGTVAVQVAPPAVVLIADRLASPNTPTHYIRPGWPYLQRDGDVAQLCVSDKAAWSYPPYTTQH
ncbi:MAG TPA: hypothetical protein VFE42_19200 [Chloroflexota bacterium]|nr:hypothetical protein [Chloroflexota bacterium]